MPVTEIKTEQIRIRHLVQRPMITTRALRRTFAVTALNIAPVSVAPVPDRPDRYITNLGVLTIKHTEIREKPSEIYCALRVHEGIMPVSTDNPTRVNYVPRVGFEPTLHGV